MGIQGLIPFLKKSGRAANLLEFKGQCTAIDAYCWLHKGAFSCAEKLAKGEPTNGYVIYFMKQLNLLLSFGIKPILVFDGCRLPSKAVTEAKRRENREMNQIKAKELLRGGNIKEARECFQRCIDVTSEMAHKVIEACRERNVDVIVAPYEADAQLAFLDKQGIATLIISEDSDLILFGCKKIMLKLDGNGGGLLIENDKIFLSMGVSSEKFSFEKFRNMCILSGCDYLPSLHGIGLAKAKRFITVSSNPDIYNNLTRLPAYLNMPQIEVTLGYREGFIRAINTINHQLVFDPVSRKLLPLNPYKSGLSHEDFPYCGKFLGDATAMQIALGNIDVQTMEIVDDFDPATYKAPDPKSTSWQSKKSSKSPRKSIWQNGFSPIKSKMAAIPSLTEERKSTRKMCAEVSVPKSLLKKRKIELNESESSASSDQELQDMYFSDKRFNVTDELPKIKQESFSSKKDNLTPPSPLRQKNPFAKMGGVSDELCKSPPKMEKSAGFSALRKFSHCRKIIVRSRYFKTEKVDDEPQDETAAEAPSDKIPETTEVAIKGSHECGNPVASPVSHTTYLPNKLNDTPKQPTNSFEWPKSKLSQKFSFKKISSFTELDCSLASRSVFCPPGRHSLPDTPPDSQGSLVEVQNSENSSENKEYSLEIKENSSKNKENSSENMENSSEIKENSSENKENSSENKEYSSENKRLNLNPFRLLKDQESSPDENGKVIKSEIRSEIPIANKSTQVLRPTCGTPQETSTASCRRPGKKTRQLNLKEMFAFKKQVPTIPS